MCYDLFHQPTELHRKFSRQSWAKALELARLSGWQPRGTHPPSELVIHGLSADWNGTYLTNDGQMVKTEDAFSLAIALERSLDNIPDASARIDWGSTLFWLEDEFPEWLSPAEKVMIEDELEDGLLDIIVTSPFEFFSGTEKHSLLELIRFCRLGSFLIF